MSETTAWRYLVTGIMFQQRTMVISRAENPLLYWPIVAAGTVLGLLAARASWRAMR